MQYRCLVGIDYADVHREVGDVADDIPAISASWLLEQGCIEPIEPSDAPSPAPKPRAKKTAGGEG